MGQTNTHFFLKKLFDILGFWVFFLTGDCWSVHFSNQFGLNELFEAVHKHKTFLYSGRKGDISSGFSYVSGPEGAFDARTQWSPPESDAYWYESHCRRMYFSEGEHDWHTVGRQRLRLQKIRSKWEKRAFHAQILTFSVNPREDWITSDDRLSCNHSIYHLIPLIKVQMALVF